MAVGQASFHHFLKKGIGIYRQNLFHLGRLFHGHKIQIGIPNGYIFNCLPRRQIMCPFLGCTTHRPFYLGAGTHKQEEMKQMCRKGFPQRKEFKPYVTVNTSINFWGGRLWPEWKTGNWSKELHEKRLWTPENIEESAIKDFDSLSHKQIMDTICFCIRYHQHICFDLLGVFLKSVNSNFHKHFPESDPELISQLMFCVFVYGHTSKPVFRMVEHILEHRLKDYSLVQVEMILCAFRRSSIVFISEKVIRQCWSKFFHTCNLAPSESVIPTRYLRQMSSYVSYLNSTEQLEEIGNYGCYQEEVEGLVTVIKVLSTARFYHAKFTQHVMHQIEKLTRSHTVIRVKTLAILCEFVANYGLEGSETYIQYFDNLLSLFEWSSDKAAMSKEQYPVLEISADGKRKPEGIFNPNQDIFPLKFAVGMMIAGKFPWPLIRSILNECSNKNTAFNNQYGLQLLQTCIDIEYPEYKGQLGTRFQEESTIADSENYEFRNHLQNLVWTSIQNIVDLNLVHKHKLLPYANKVIEIRLNEKNSPTGFDPVPYHKLPSSFKHSHNRIVVLIHNKRQTTFNGGYPLGLLKLQKRHLKKLGYNVIEIPVHSHKDLKRDDAEQNMTKMLRKKFEDFDVVLEQGRQKAL